MSSRDSNKTDEPDPTRRGFLSRTASAAMGAGLLAGYGTFGYFGARFLFPAKEAKRGWLFVSEIGRIAPGDSVTYRTPAGEPVAIARQGRAGTADDFIALSSTCPHLGCQVHWEGQHNRFFCPCHNGTFDPAGKATAGPPAEAGQSLLRYPLKVESGLLFIQVPVESLADGEGTIDDPESNTGPGHDPCLYAKADTATRTHRQTASDANADDPEDVDQGGIA